MLHHARAECKEMQHAHRCAPSYVVDDRVRAGQVAVTTDIET